MINKTLTFSIPLILMIYYSQGIVVAEDKIPQSFEVTPLTEEKAINVPLETLFGSGLFTERTVLVFITKPNDDGLKLAKAVQYVGAQNATVEQRLYVAVVYLGEPNVEATETLKGLAVDKDGLKIQATKYIGEVPKEYEISTKHPVAVMMWKGRKLEFESGVSEEDRKDPKNRKVPNEVLNKFTGLFI